MTKHLKIASIVGARPNFIKLAPIHRELDKCTEHTIIHTGQHYDYEMSSIFFKEFSLPEPDFNLEVGSGPAGYQVGEMIKGIENILVNDDYDLIIVYGDTNSTFAGAFAAVKSGIRVAHVEAGLRSFDRRMPEETNRILTDHISNHLFAPTASSINNLYKENVFGRVYNTGDISVEIINEAVKLCNSSPILDNLDIISKDYILFTMHRAENTESNSSFLSIFRVFENLIQTKIVFPIHPRTKKILEERNLYTRLCELKNVILTPPCGYIDFVNLMYNAKKVVTDSGGIQKESYLLKVPCITIRDNTEWIETITTGWNKLVGIDHNKIIDSIENWNPSNVNYRPIFGTGNTSNRIKQIVSRDLG